ncbi:hypothetical protein [Neolewinella persica]|uniref:hypothetical protein n=1 Tax=Neolewinella persica TaxID=70998 RepID=UPI00039BE963|nr:hypothetical protein [Neolewinella persica]
MRNILTLTFLCLTTLLAGQNRQDTVYTRWGQVSNIKHFSKIDTEGVSKSYLFQRGLSMGDEVWQLDSISVYNAEGKLVRTRSAEEMDSGSSQTSGTVRQKTAQRVDPLAQKRRDFSDRLSAVDIVHVAGHAGTKATAILKIWVRGEEDLPLQFINKPDNISLSGLGKALPPGSHELKVTVDMVPGVGMKIIQLAGPNQTYDIRLALRGYDLTEGDFTPSSSPAELKQFDASEREHLYLRLESTEKLLKLYQGDKLRFRVPVGRQIDQVPVYHLPPGDYRMEIIDLSTGEKQSYGLKR